VAQVTTFFYPEVLNISTMLLNFHWQAGCHLPDYAQGYNGRGTSSSRPPWSPLAEPAYTESLIFDGFSHPLARSALQGYSSFLAHLINHIREYPRTVLLSPNSLCIQNQGFKLHPQVFSFSQYSPFHFHASLETIYPLQFEVCAIISRPLCLSTHHGLASV